jgi:alkanesulfonate monooxygenase SsuD/methylene tetrahydromethanopterin reductase-like flavin-dependent oxidoreductase (luciferase family)
LPENAGRGGIGTPAQLREHLSRYEKAGIDQVMFVQQSGANRHEHICESLETFASQVMPASRNASRLGLRKNSVSWLPASRLH